MLVGIDGSRASSDQKTGTENYSLSLISALIDSDRQNKYEIYLRKDVDFGVGSHDNISKKIISLPRLWTQLGLALEVALRPPELLFIPAHTLPVLRRQDMKTVVTIHDLGYEFLPEYHKFPQKFYLNKSTVYAAKKASHLIAVSEATKQDLVTKLGVDPAKITVVYEGFDSKNYKPASKEAIKAVKQKFHLNNYLLFVGTIQPRKNLENLLRAYAKVYRKIDCDIVLSGKRGWLDDKIMELPKELGIGDRVKFLGYTTSEDLPALYSGAKAFVYPSLFEGFGIPILEAFACHTPVLTSNISSMPEVAKDSALLVDPYDIDSIGECIIQIISNDVLRNQLIKRGKDRVQYFSWDKCAEETIKVFEKVYNQ